MNTERTHIIKALTVVLLAAISLPAGAANERHGAGGMHGGFRGGPDIRHFDRHDYAVWRSGGWRHEWHGGRLGWWWVAAGVWYFYPEPIYPYPDPYVPPVVVTQPVPQPEPPQAQFWYFCTSANGYYPYVSACPEGWKAVPATPAPAPR